MKTNGTRAAQPALLSIRELMLILGIRSRQTIYQRLREDATFPKPRRTGPNSIAWLREEVMQWIVGLPSAELNGLDAIERRGGPSREERTRRKVGAV